MSAVAVTSLLAVHDARRNGRLTVALSRDDGCSLDLLERQLTTHERAAAVAHNGRRRRHFALGRLAARAAIDVVRGAAPRQRSGRAADAAVWIDSEPGGAPTVRGLREPLGLAVAHSGTLAVACAWTIDRGKPREIGIDLERVRRSEVARSPYAFSHRERRVLRGAGIDDSLSGLMGWIAKEAAWKALRLPPTAGPSAVELTALDPSHGYATVIPRPDAVSDGEGFHVRFRALRAPDGDYVLGVAARSHPIAAVAGRSER